jgi:restriction system protein
MSLPKYNELYSPFLAAIQDGMPHNISKVKDAIAEQLQLSEESLAEQLPSGTQTVFANRVGWAKTYLKKAGLIESPKRAFVSITSEGKKLLASGVDITDSYLMEKYPAFKDFKKGPSELSPESQVVSSPLTASEETPQETFERVYKSINDALADDLLTEIMNQSSNFFESLVVDLMRAMGYGDGFVTKSSNDGGIDGIIHEDKLGFNLIYIQAKRWKPDTTITKPEIQKFAGAMMGPPKVEKGLFITTAKFSPGARQFAEAQHIILVDGQKLTELMIEYELGVTTQKTYKIKRVDSDYFSDVAQMN